MRSMNKIISFLILSALLPNLLFAGTTVSLRERKKTLDSRIKILKEIDSAMSGWNLENFNQRIQEIQFKSDSAYREKTGTEQAKIMNYLEGDLHLLQMSYSDKLEEKAQDLIEVLSREIVMNRNAADKLDISRRERSQRYFDMAKKEKEQGLKYHRMNNPTLALYSFKRSIVYSFHTFYEYNFSLPTDSVATYQYWIKKDLPNSPMISNFPSENDPELIHKSTQTKNTNSSSLENLKD